MQATDAPAPGPDATAAAPADAAAPVATVAATPTGETGAVTKATEGTSEPAKADDGLPQFDTSKWPGQIVWFLIVFFVVFLLSKFVFVPKIGGTIDARDGKIDGDIAEARKLKADADAAAEAAAADLAAGRAAAQKVASDARSKAQAESAAALAVEEAKLAETTSAAEARIGKARDVAMGNVATIAADTASAIVEHLTGSAATAKELAAGQA
jgi:F-type H+-transporting ATPase subunit b